MDRVTVIYSKRMKPLDVSHELKVNPELPELPPPHYSQAFNWLFSLAIGVAVMFIVTLVLLMTTANLFLTFIIAPILLVFVTLVVHAVADRAR